MPKRATLMLHVQPPVVTIACNSSNEQALPLDLSWCRVSAESHLMIQILGVLALFCGHPAGIPGFRLHVLADATDCTIDHGISKIDRKLW